MIPLSGYSTTEIHSGNIIDYNGSTHGYEDGVGYYFQIIMRYYNDKGNDNVVKAANMTINGKTVFTVDGWHQSDASGYTCGITPQNGTYLKVWNTKWNYGTFWNSGRQTFWDPCSQMAEAIIRIYIPNDLLGQTLNWKFQVTSNESIGNISKSGTVDAFNYPNITLKNSLLSDGYYSLKYNLPATDNDMLLTGTDVKSSMTLNKSGNGKVLQQSNLTNGDVTFKVSALESITPGDFYVNWTKNLSYTYTTDRTNLLVHLKNYPSAKDISSTNNNDGTVTIKWLQTHESDPSTTEPDTVDYNYDGYYRIEYQRFLDSTWSEWATIDARAKEVKSKTNVENTYGTGYSYEFEIPEDEREQGIRKYKFRISRDLFAATSGVESEPIEIQTNYERPTNVYFDANTKKLYFDKIDGISTVGYTITKEANAIRDSWSTYKTSKDTIGNYIYTYCTNSGIGDCQPTTYIITATVNGENLSRPATLKNVTYQPSGERELVSFSASKGYYNDHIDVKWVVNKHKSDFTSFLIHKYAINVNEADGTCDSTEVKIDGVKGYVVDFEDSKYEYEIEDKSIVPGRFYLYTITGQMKCDTVLTQDAPKNDLGYAVTYGTISGKVTYDGSTTGVANCDILFENADTLSNVISKNRSLVLGSSQKAGAIVIPTTYTSSYSNYTMQVWCKLNEKLNNQTLYKGYDNKGTQLEILVDENGKLKVRLYGDDKYMKTLSDTTLPFNDYFQLTTTVASKYNATTESYSYTVGFYLNGKSAGSITVDTNSESKFSFTKLMMGSDSTANRLSASIDELRIWDKVLPANDIKANYDRYISSSSNGLKGYYRFDEPYGNLCYDISVINVTEQDFNENHATFLGDVKRSSYDVPKELCYKSLTNESGDYSATNLLPYSTEGTVYTITPKLGVHKFDPTNRKRTISSNATTIDEVNFSDVSSFKYNGKVIYKGGSYPVEGCSFYVDGVQQMDSAQNIITTDDKGQFSLNIPVGTHTIKVSKNGHTFVKDTIRKNFQDEELAYNVRFEDITRVRVIGRVVGGNIQSSKHLGFSESKNNIGTAKIILVQKNDFGASYVYDSVTNAIKHFNPADSNIVTFEPSTITIHTSAQSGEFYADLYPEPYKINKIDLNGKNLLNGETQSWDLTNAINEAYKTRTTKDTVIPNAKYPEKYDVVEHTDSVMCQDTFCYVYRVNPSLTVVELSNSNKIKADNDINYFGEDEFIYKGEFAEKEDTIHLYKVSGDTIQYEFGHPIYSQGDQYKFKVAVNEQYTNYETKKVDIVPLGGESIKVIDELSKDPTAQSLELDDNGEYIYTTVASVPSLTTGLKTLEIDYPCTSAVCPEWSMSAIIIGGKTTGSNFATQGPSSIFYVLRDPPGSNSYAYREAESSTTITNSWKVEQSFSAGAKTMFKLGTSKHVINLVGGVAASVGTQEDFDFTNDIGVGIEANESFDANGNKVTTVTNTERVQTSDDPSWVGSDADVYVGSSTNILYGNSDLINIIDSTGAKTYESQLFKSRDGKFVIGMVKGVSIGMSFGTTFQYTQSTIENVLIPEWQSLIKSLFVFEDTATVRKAKKSYPVYCSHRKADDENFGKSNSNGTSDGDSYTIVFPSNWTIDNQIIRYTDSVDYFNRQIESWKDAISKNEHSKVNAKSSKDAENYSFGDGVTIEYSMKNDTSKTTAEDVDAEIVQSSEGNCGFNLSGTGMQLTVTQSFSVKAGYGHQKDTDNSTTYGYVLSDQTENNKISVDVIEPNTDQIIGGYIFLTKGGQTSCPYEGGDSTKYYKPGTPLNAKTMQIEVPELKVTSNKVVTGVPADGQAVYELQLLNASETQSDNWYTLRVNSETNPYGAVIRLDGKVLTEEGTSIYVPYGADGVKKTLTIERGPKKYEYNDIELVLASSCDDSKDKSSSLISTVQLSASYLQGCSDLTLSSPLDQWTVNTNTGTKMQVTVNGFDKNGENLGYIDIQYKESYSSTWNSLKKYYFNEAAYKQSSDQNKELFDESEITYVWDMTKLADGDYDLRAVSVCIDGTTFKDIARTNSATLSGTKDMVRPQLFGRPEPKDGVLDVDDEILIQFNEPIACSRGGNITVTGIKNHANGDHSTAVHFDGNSKIVTDDATIKAPFSIEMWVKRENADSAVIFSHNNDSMLIGFNKNGYLFVEMGDEKVTSDDSLPSGEWMHIAISQDSTGYMHGEVAYSSLTSEFEHDLTAYNQKGAMILGNNAKGKNGITADIHQLCIWNDVRSESEITSNKYALYAGNEANLSHYYPLNEGIGTVATDKAGALNGKISAQWMLYHGGQAIATSKDNKVTIPATNFGFNTEDDYSVEFWFQGDAQKSACMLSAGNGNGNDFDGSSSKLSVYFNEDGELTVASNGKTYSLTGNYTDKNWHHFALAVNRLSDADIYVDGELKQIVSSSDFGGMVTDSITLGARRWNKKNEDGVSTKVVDMPFSGLIDQVNIWEGALDDKFIVNQRNVKKTGEENGLVACYPFETYATVDGTETMSFSKKDLVNGDVANVPSNAISNEYAPIKDAGPVENLAFSTVCNGDKLLITLDEKRSTIEKSTITISVSGIQDVNGNKMESAAIWSAYIDQAQLRWEQSSLDLEALASNGTSGEVKITNTGAKTENFEITNIPAWLTISQTTGSVDAQKSVSIKFTVDKTVEAGKYSQTLLLNSSSVDQLTVNLNMKNESPAWSVKATDYQYSMSVVSNLSIDNVYSTDENDMIGVFVNDTCRGVAQVKYESNYGRYVAYLTMYSNEVAGDVFTYRIWDASAGEIRVANTTADIEFKDGYTRGTVSSPITFATTNETINNFDLKKGWNWVSFNIANDVLTSVDKTLSDMKATKNDVIKSNGESIFASYSAKESKWKGTLSSLNNTRMYHIYSGADNKFSVIAQPASNTKITINHGINFIGYLPSNALSVSEALASYSASDGDVIKSQTAFAVYENGSWNGDLKTMEPMQGYILDRKDSKSTSFSYPSSSFNSTDSTSTLRSASVYDGLNVNEYSDNMNVIAKLKSAKVAQSGDVLVAYANNEVRGAEAIEDENDLLYMTLYGDSINDNITFKLIRDNKVVAVSNESVTYESNTLRGASSNPMAITFSEVSGEENNCDVVVYPTFFDNELTINFSSDNAQKATVKVYDVLSRLVMTDEISITEGKQDYTINTTNFANGQYLVVIYMSQDNYVTKVYKK